MFILQAHMVCLTNEIVDFQINRNTTTLMALITMENEMDECDTKIIGKFSITNRISCNVYCY